MNKIFEKLINTKTQYKEITELNPTGEFDGIKAITYDGLDADGKKTKVFAYLGYPEAGEKAPAVILAHGGGGVAFLSWVKMWNERGYVALAMSNTGDFPKEINAGEKECPTHKEPWQHGLHGVFEEEGYVGIFDNDEMKNTDKPYDRQWMYHAVASVIAANNILHNDPRVDSSKIGICGISWGGVITSLTLGFDNRFAFAIPIYGSGYLGQSHGWMKNHFGNAPEWLAETRFSNINMPVLWLCWNADAPFSVNSNSLSYVDTVKNNNATRLSMVDKMGHSHACGWVRKECFAFADSVVMGKPQLPGMYNDTIINPDNVEIVGTKVFYLTKPLAYNSETNAIDEEWNVTEGNIVPNNAKVYYIELTSEIDGTQYITTSELVELI